MTLNVPSTGQARGVGEQDYEQHNPDHRGETARAPVLSV